MQMKLYDVQCALYTIHYVMYHSKIYWGHFRSRYMFNVQYQLENHSWIIFFMLNTVENSHRAIIWILCSNPINEIVSTMYVLNYKLRYNVIWMCENG